MKSQITKANRKFREFFLNNKQIDQKRKQKIIAKMDKIVQRGFKSLNLNYSII